MLPASGGDNHELPQKSMLMTLPEASSVKDRVEKEQINESLTTAINNADYNGGGGSGGEINMVPQPRKNQTRMQSDENLKKFVEAWLARPHNARVSSTLLPTAKEKEENIQGCGVDKKRLESLFYRMRKKPKQKRWGCCCYW